MDKMTYRKAVKVLKAHGWKWDGFQWVDAKGKCHSFNEDRLLRKADQLEKGR